MTKQRSKPEPTSSETDSTEQFELGIMLVAMSVGSSIVAGFFTIIWIPIIAIVSILLLVSVLTIANITRKLDKPLRRSFVQLAKVSDRMTKYWPF